MLMGKLISVPGTGEIDVFFDETMYHVDNKTISDIALSAVRNGEITGFDLTLVDTGRIKCYYNPTRMDLSSAQRGSKRIVEYIASCSKEHTFSGR